MPVKEKKGPKCANKSVPEPIRIEFESKLMGPFRPSGISSMAVIPPTHPLHRFESYGPLGYTYGYRL